MTEPDGGADPAAPMLTLIVRRTVRASAERLFDAWTQPAALVAWWGPGPMTCPEAEVDLRVGGAYRLANKSPDGTVVWIVGEYERIDRPHALTYTWCMEPGPGDVQRVSVRFVPKDDETEIIVTHERIADVPMRDMHEQGWFGCLDGLVELMAQG